MRYSILEIKDKEVEKECLQLTSSLNTNNVQLQQLNRDELLKSLKEIESSLNSYIDDRFINAQALKTINTYAGYISSAIVNIEDQLLFTNERALPILGELINQTKEFSNHKNDIILNYIASISDYELAISLLESNIESLQKSDSAINTINTNPDLLKKLYVYIKDLSFIESDLTASSDILKQADDNQRISVTALNKAISIYASRQRTLYNDLNMDINKAIRIDSLCSDKVNEIIKEREIDITLKRFSLIMDEFKKTEFKNKSEFGIFCKSINKIADKLNSETYIHNDRDKINQVIQTLLNTSSSLNNSKLDESILKSKRRASTILSYNYQALKNIASTDHAKNLTLTK